MGKPQATLGAIFQRGEGKMLSPQIPFPALKATADQKEMKMQDIMLRYVLEVSWTDVIPTVKLGPAKGTTFVTVSNLTNLPPGLSMVQTMTDLSSMIMYYVSVEAQSPGNFKLEPMPLSLLNQLKTARALEPRPSGAGMTCKNCANPLPDTAKFCNKCGTKT